MTENIKGYVNKLTGTSIIKTIWYNLLSGRVERHESPNEAGRQFRVWGGVLLVGRDVRMKLGRNSRIIVYGICRIGYSDIRGVNKAVLKMEDNARLELHHGVDILAGAKVVIQKGGNMRVGRGSSVNNEDLIVCTRSINIGDEVSMAPGVTIRDSMGHKPGGHPRVEPIVIGNHVWLATGATVLSGVTIGEGSIVAAHAVVNKNMPENSLVAGVPAKEIKEGVYWDF